MMGRKIKRGSAIRITSPTQPRAGLPLMQGHHKYKACLVAKRLTVALLQPLHRCHWLATKKVLIVGYVMLCGQELRRPPSLTEPAGQSFSTTSLQQARPADSISFLKKTHRCELRLRRFIYKHCIRNDCPVWRDRCKTKIEEM